MWGYGEKVARYFLMLSLNSSQIVLLSFEKHRWEYAKNSFQSLLKQGYLSQIFHRPILYRISNWTLGQSIDTGTVFDGSSVSILSLKYSRRLSGVADIRGLPTSNFDSSIRPVPISYNWIHLAFLIWIVQAFIKWHNVNFWFLDFFGKDFTEIRCHIIITWISQFICTYRKQLSSSAFWKHNFKEGTNVSVLVIWISFETLSSDFSLCYFWRCKC